MEKVRAKFECHEVAKTVHGQTVRMRPVTGGSKDNDSFFKWTPCGNLEMGTVNSDVNFEPGKKYYLDFTEAAE